MNGFDHWVLTGAIFVPIIGAIVVIAFIPRRDESAIKVAALLTTLVTLADRHLHWSASTSTPRHLQPGADPGRALQFAVNRPWIDVINSRYHVGIDGISLPLLVLSMFITVPLRDLQLGPLPRAPRPQGAS